MARIGLVEDRWPCLRAFSPQYFNRRVFMYAVYKKQGEKGGKKTFLHGERYTRPSRPYDNVYYENNENNTR